MTETKSNVQRLKAVRRVTEDTPDWSRTCESCGDTPVHPVSGMCGPCTFGEASTAGGDW